MAVNPTQKRYWGMGLENETYLQFEESLHVSGKFIQEKMGCERYSIDYRQCYKPGTLARVLNAAFHPDHQFKISRMINSHSLDKLDQNYEHKTLYAQTDARTDYTPHENPDYAGKSILELFLEGQPHNVRSIVAQKNNPMGSVTFDGDSIEFVTKYFENRTVIDSCNELKTTKKLFLDKLNESKVINEELYFPEYNSGINMFMSNLENLVLFNNGTYHFHITLPTINEHSRIVNYPEFDKMHAKAIYLLQWFEPFFIATLGSPDVLGVISKNQGLKENFALGSMRNAMSRYTGVGTFHKSMIRGKILTYKVDDFRKLLKYEKEENIWWRDQIESDMEYDLLSEIGLDFNQEKMYQSGFEFRSFDEFPASYLKDVLLAILTICEHSIHLTEVPWGHDSTLWNNLVFKSIKHGHATEITDAEKAEILLILQFTNHKDTLQLNSINKLDDFFFKILEILHARYKEQNVCIDAMYGEQRQAAPKWANFNKFQYEQHLKQITALA
jgi:hypothetical protein